MCRSQDDSSAHKLLQISNSGGVAGSVGGGCVGPSQRRSSQPGVWLRPRGHCWGSSQLLAPGDVAHLHITSHHISSTAQKWSKSEKSPKSPNPSRIADRASGSILEPPEGPKYDFRANIWEIEKIANFENLIEIFGGRFSVFFRYFSVTSLGARCLM